LFAVTKLNARENVNIQHICVNVANVISHHIHLTQDELQYLEATCIGSWLNLKLAV